MSIKLFDTLVNISPVRVNIMDSDPKYPWSHGSYNTKTNEINICTKTMEQSGADPVYVMIHELAHSTMPLTSRLTDLTKYKSWTLAEEEYLADAVAIKIMRDLNLFITEATQIMIDIRMEQAKPHVISELLMRVRIQEAYCILAELLNPLIKAA